MLLHFVKESFVSKILRLASSVSTFLKSQVAAGMESKLVVEIYAIAVGVEGDSGVGTINHLLEIIAESEIIQLPITAYILRNFQT